MNRVSWESKVANPRGVHCRVASRLTELVANHDAKVQIAAGNETADCTSILEILSLSLSCGSRVQFTAQGPDAHRVAAAIDHLLASEEES